MGGARTALIAAVLVGFAVGLGLFTFVYAKGASYLSTNPGVCANCHIMQEHFEAWQRSSHRVFSRLGLSALRGDNVPAAPLTAAAASAHRPKRD